jgi:DNA-directed RNA polymerase subunit RPC12/RpoP
LRRADDHAGATLIIPLQGTSEPDPGTRAVFEGIGDTTILFRGTENTVAYACHSCGATLLLGVDIDTVSNIVLRCANCKSFNESQPATAPPS